MATGYSGTPLIKKLGIQPDTSVHLINPPENYFSFIEADISDQLCQKTDTPDIVHLFVTTRKEFEGEMKKMRKVIRQNPKIVIWVSWYKKSSGKVTDLTEDVIRNFALDHDFVDVKVCAVNDLWSGLKLVVPLSKRK